MGNIIPTYDCNQSGVICTETILVSNIYQFKSQVHPDGSIYNNIPFFTIFIVEICVLVVVIIVGCVSLFVSSVNNIFVYMLLLV